MYKECTLLPRLLGNAGSLDGFRGDDHVGIRVSVSEFLKTSLAVLQPCCYVTAVYWTLLRASLCGVGGVLLRMLRGCVVVGYPWVCSLVLVVHLCYLQFH